MASQKTIERKPTPQATSLANLRSGGGRPKGMPNKVTGEVRELAQRLFDDAYWERTRVCLAQGWLAPAVECRLLASASGEPEMQAPPPQWTFNPATLAKMSTEDLKRALAHAEQVQHILADCRRSGDVQHLS